ncbi:hypothetical protein EAE96_009573 [Botrytis aclada]|nr:hypothetical protein EAE96_009573 [Botrytis aclada]
MDHSNNMNPQPSSSDGVKKSKNKKSRAKKFRSKKSRAVEGPQGVTAPQDVKEAQAVKEPQAMKGPQGVDKGTQTNLPPLLTEFPLFPELPLEIRNQIWRSSFEGRKVELRAGRIRPTPHNQPLHPNYPFEQYGPDQLICKQLKIPPTSIIPVAFVNRESRAETLRHYVRLYQDVHYPEHGPNLRYPCTIYFNPQIDLPLFYANKPQYMFDKITLSLERLFPSHDALAVEAMKSIRKLEMVFEGSFASHQHSYDMDGCRDALAMFENLESVLMISTNLRPNPRFDMRAFLSRYFARPENRPRFNRAPGRLELWIPPDWLIKAANPAPLVL